MSSVSSGAIERRTDGGIMLRLHIKPGAKLSRVTEIGEHSIGMQIAAPPREGEANEEAIKFTAQVLGVKPRQLQLVAGHKSRDKVLLFSEPNMSVEDIRSKLKDKL